MLKTEFFELNKKRFSKTATNKLLAESRINTLSLRRFTELLEIVQCSSIKTVKSPG
jgi:hypothetical protein